MSESREEIKTIPDFVAWLREQEKVNTENLTPDQAGGFLVPETLRVPRSGLFAWVCRLFKRERGWKTVRFSSVIAHYEKEGELPEDLFK
jgi:hypothetical protein